MNRRSNFNNEVIEFVILEDYTKEKSMGKKLQEVAPGKMEKVTMIKEIKTRNVKSRITVYTCDVRMVRELQNNKLKPFKDRSMIKMVNNDVFVVNEPKHQVEERLFKIFKSSKIGF